MLGLISTPLRHLECHRFLIRRVTRFQKIAYIQEKWFAGNYICVSDCLHCRSSSLVWRRCYVSHFISAFASGLLQERLPWQSTLSSRWTYHGWHFYNLTRFTKSNITCKEYQFVFHLSVHVFTNFYSCIEMLLNNTDIRWQILKYGTT